jgi:hypothetical protein
MMRGLLLVLLIAAAVMACKPPRNPREVSEGRVTGTWTARSAAVGAPRDTGQAVWRLTFFEHAAGKVDGHGSVAVGGAMDAFVLQGHRGEAEFTFEFKLPRDGVKFHGSVIDPKTITGEMQMPKDTLHITLTREKS